MGVKFVRDAAFLGLFIAFSCLTAANPDELRAVLAIGASAKVPGADVTVTFEEVVEDSRCPTGADCIWEGDAAVKIRLNIPNASPSNYTLHTNKQFVREIEHGGVRILLVAVTPHPTAEAAPRRDEYRITLSLKRK
jgi:hypothetical protein